MSCKSRAKPPSLFRYFNSSPEVFRLVVMMYVRFPLSLRNVEDLVAERGVDICHGLCQKDGAGASLALPVDDAGDKFELRTRWFASPSTRHHFGNCVEARQPFFSEDGFRTA